MALTERLSLYLSPEAKRRVVQEVNRRRARGEEFATANQTSVIEELIMTHLPPADPEGPVEDRRGRAVVAARRIELGERSLSLRKRGTRHNGLPARAGMD